MSGLLTVVAVVGFLAFGLLQIYAGFIGIEHELNGYWAYASLLLMFFARFTLPLTIGSFFGAWHVWHWHWALAALFAAPGLFLVIPGTLASLYEIVTARFRPS